MLTGSNHQPVGAEEQASIYHLPYELLLSIIATSQDTASGIQLLRGVCKYVKLMIEKSTQRLTTYITRREHERISKLHDQCSLISVGRRLDLRSFSCFLRYWFYRHGISRDDRTQRRSLRRFAILLERTSQDRSRIHSRSFFAGGLVKLELCRRGLLSGDDLEPSSFYRNHREAARRDLVNDQVRQLCNMVMSGDFGRATLCSDSRGCLVTTRSSTAESRILICSFLPVASLIACTTRSLEGIWSSGKATSVEKAAILEYTEIWPE